MRLKRRIEQLFNYIQTDRILIHDLERRHLDLVNRIYVLEQIVEGK